MKLGALTPFKAGLLLAPLLLRGLVPFGILPPAVAYVVEDARWLVVCGAVAAFLAQGLRVWYRPVALWPLLAGALERLRPQLLVGAGWLAAFALAVCVIPAYRWTGESWSGDEPKYLRLVESLYADLDVDVSGGWHGPVGPARLAANARALLRSTRTAVRGLFVESPVPSDHRWNLGNWTLAGRDGGHYYVQSPGLPLILLPGRALQGALFPGAPEGQFALYTLALLWAVAVVQAALLAADVARSRLAGVVAAALAGLSAPVLVGAYHVYPETVAVALVPWLMRWARASGPQPGPLRVVALAGAIGSLLWLHPKFLLLMLAFSALLARKLWRKRGLRSLAGVALAAPLLTRLLFDHHVTGLLRPDAFYLRYGPEVYTGAMAFLSAELVSGLAKALFGARDGLLIMAPVLGAGVLALSAWVRSDRRTARECAVVFGSLWLAAAVHGGGAPGPPARLMAPVACLLSAPLAVGLTRLRSSLAFRWTASALTLVTLAITLTLLQDWRRTVNPYRGMFTTETDFARDLPGGHHGPHEAAPPPNPGGDALRGSILGAVLLFWAWVLSRSGPRAENSTAGATWPAIRNVHAVWWGTLAAVSWILQAAP